MRKLLAAASAVAALVGGTAVTTSVQAESIRANDPNLIQAGFIYGGRNYCWYDSAWRGPGWYWCGAPWHSGYGWGGGYGWHGWVGGHPVGYYGHPGWHPGYGYHGGYNPALHTYGHHVWAAQHHWLAEHHY